MSLFNSSVCHRDLLSFPTRRSSDLVAGFEILALARDDDEAVGPAESGDGAGVFAHGVGGEVGGEDRKSTRLNSSHVSISYAVFCLKKKNDDLVDLVSVAVKLVDELA